MKIFVLIILNYCNYSEQVEAFTVEKTLFMIVIRRDLNYNRR